MSTEPILEPGDHPQPKTLIPVRIEEALAALVMAVLVLITFANVLVRYFTDFSFAFTEEYSIALMVILTFLGASVAVVRDRHMRLTFLAGKLPAKGRARLEAFSALATAAMFALLAVYGGFSAWDDYRFEVTSPALGLPQWIYTIWLPLLSIVVMARALGRCLRLARGAEKARTGP